MGWTCTKCGKKKFGPGGDRVCGTCEPPVAGPARLSEKIRVGLDQWVIVSPSSAGYAMSLCTDGLSGCVALAFVSSAQACLAHVSSDLNADNWPAYRHQLELPCAVMGKLTQVRLVHGDHQQTPRVTLLQKWALDKTENVQIVKGSGMLVSSDGGGGWSYHVKTTGDRNYTDYVSTTTTAKMDNWGKLSSSASPSGLPGAE